MHMLEVFKFGGPDGGSSCSSGPSLSTGATMDLAMVALSLGVRNGSGMGDGSHCGGPDGGAWGVGIWAVLPARAAAR